MMSITHLTLGKRLGFKSAPASSTAEGQENVVARFRERYGVREVPWPVKGESGRVMEEYLIAWANVLQVDLLCVGAAWIIASR